MAARTGIIIPLGYDAARRTAESRRKLGDLMLQQGMANDPHMQSWVQVLGHLAQDWAGNRSIKQADDMDSSTDAKMRQDYAARVANFNAATAGGKVDPAAVVRQFGTDPMLQEQVKPYQDAMAAGLTEGAKHTNFGGQWRQNSGIADGEFEPNKPTASVLRDANGNFLLNPVRATASLEAQGYTPMGQPPMGVSSMRDPQLPPVAPPAPVPGPPMAPNGPVGGPMVPPGANAVTANTESGGRDYYPGGKPVVSPKGAMYAMQVMPSTAHNPGFGVTPAQNDSPQEYDRVGQDYLAAMARRYGGDMTKAWAAYNGGPGRVDHAIQSAGPGFMGQMPAETQNYVSTNTNALKPPAGVAGGKPYWLINGVPYDNPEGN